jgi:hypothetical protein
MGPRAVLEAEEKRKIPSSLNIIRMIKSKIRWAEGKFEVGKCEKPERKRVLGRPTRRWKDNITMNIEERGCELDSNVSV